jgi:hypothetical protein
MGKEYLVFRIDFFYFASGNPFVEAAAEDVDKPLLYQT